MIKKKTGMKSIMVIITISLLPSKSQHPLLVPIPPHEVFNVTVSPVKSKKTKNRIFKSKRPYDLFSKPDQNRGN
jgi:hypothetical protein